MKRKIILLALAAVALAACDNKKFYVEGQITDANDSVMYLENITLDGDLVQLDSVKLDEKGDFKLEGKATDAPEFYRLRIAGQIINLSIDSTETVTVTASYPTMATGYTVEGSYNCEKIRELSLMQLDLVKRMREVNRDETLSVDAANDSLLNMLNAYKEKVRHDYIFKEPDKAYAYFALFQTVGNMLIFNPQSNKDDVKTFAAVATSWDTFHPGALRTENLHNIAVEGVKTSRIVQQKQEQSLNPALVNETGVIDIPLKDNSGKQRSLTELKGKVVMLDFHLFSAAESTERIMLMRELYNKFHDRGFEIYQVSLDNDEHFWKTKTAALPWVNVHDPNGLSSSYLKIYNVQAVPTYFLISKDNVLHKRDIQIQDIEQEISNLL